jgi:hypothetical protein
MPKEVMFRNKPGRSAFDVDVSMYERYDYRVMIIIQLFHDHPRGNIREGQSTKPKAGRYYHLTFQPEEDVFGDDQKTERYNLSIQRHFEDFISSKKEHIHEEQLSVGYILVRRAYKIATKALGAQCLSGRHTFTAKDVIDAFPWIKPSVLHHRVKRGFIPLREKPAGQGIPILFTFPELVHCGVIDELASLGVFSDVKRVSVNADALNINIVHIEVI